MKDIRCMFGFHDWTQWRRASKLKIAPPGTPNVGGTVHGERLPTFLQHRRCKRCGEKESRARQAPKHHEPTMAK